MRAKTCSNVTIKKTITCLEFYTVRTGSGLLSHLGQVSEQWLSNSVWSLLQKAMFAFMVNAAYIHSIVNYLSISLPHIPSLPMSCLPRGNSTEVIHSITAAQINTGIQSQWYTVSESLCSSRLSNCLGEIQQPASADSSVLLRKQSSYLIIHWSDIQKWNPLIERWC